MIWGILTLATILRLISINQSLWLDEAINVLAAKNLSFWDFVTKYPIGDFHPPGYFALLWVWSHIFGYSEVSVRLPSVILGIATIWLVYLIGKDLFNKKVALLAGLLLTTAPLHVYYSQETRMYSLAAFSAALSFYFFWKLIKQSNKENLVLYTFANILVLSSDYLTYLIFPAQFIYLAFRSRYVHSSPYQEWRFKEVLIGWIGAGIFLIPWLIFIFPTQLASGANAVSSLPGWSSVVGGASIKELLLIPVKTLVGRFTLENKTLYYGLVGVISAIYSTILILGFKKLNQETKLLLCWLTVPVALAFIISFFIPVLSYFRLLFILSAFYLLLAYGLTNLPFRLFRPALIVILLISAFFLSSYYLNPNFQRENWKEAVGAVESRTDQDSVVILENNDIFAPYQYYTVNPFLAKTGLKKVPALSFFDVNLDNFQGAKEIYLFEYLVDITDPNRLLESQIQLRGFKKKDTLNFPGVGFIHHYIKTN